MKKEKRFLITTAIEETWVEDQPSLFLGEWCRLYSQKNRWSKMNAKVLTYHWSDRDKFYSDFKYLNSLYERNLDLLAKKLNQINNVRYSLRYWRIFAGPWLAYFIQILFDRWLSIENADNCFDITGTIILKSAEDRLVPNAMNQFAELMIGDEWNHYIYSEILQKYSKVPIICFRSEAINQNALFNATKRSISKQVTKGYSWVAKHFVKHSDAFIISTCLGKLNEFRLHLKLGQIPQFWQTVKPVEVELDRLQRNWTMPGCAENNFEQFVLSMIPKQIPKIFLEGYSQLTKQIHDLPWAKHPRVIYTTNALFYDAVSTAYTAEKTEQGAPLVYGQHGGGYGTAKFHFAEEHEIKISDRYLTWGWHSNLAKHTYPVGITKVANMSLNRLHSKKILLFVTMNIPRYTFLLCAESAINYQNYIDSTFSFVRGLNINIYKKLLVRISPVEAGLSLPKRWHDRFPFIQTDSGGSNIYSLFNKSRIVVQTYNQTGVLETLALGIPTVLFCDLKVSPLRDAAIPYYSELKRIGIFHDTPESASAHVNAIWDNVDAWWSRDDVREVRSKFTRQYCHRTDNLLDRVAAEFSKVIAESMNKKTFGPQAATSIANT